MTTKMTESAYIIRGDLMAVMCARDALRQIIAESNPCIVSEDYLGVINLLDEWSQLMFSEIECVQPEHTQSEGK